MEAAGFILIVGTYLPYHVVSHPRRP